MKECYAAWLHNSRCGTVWKLLGWQPSIGLGFIEGRCIALQDLVGFSVHDVKFMTQDTQSELHAGKGLPTVLRQDSRDPA